MCAMFSDEGERLPRVSQYKEALASTALPIIKMRRSHDSLIFIMGFPTPLLWRHNETDGVSNHQPHDCLLNRLFGHWSKKTSKLRVTGLCAGNSPVPGEFPAQMASNAEMFPFDDVIMLRREPDDSKWCICSDAPSETHALNIIFAIGFTW